MENHNLKSEIYSLINYLPHNIKNSYENVKIPLINFNFKEIKILGMGGSYAVALLFKEFIKEELSLPIEVWPGPIYSIKKDELIILISYSGNTKELIESYKKIKEKDKVVILTSGGKLFYLGKINKSPIIEITKNVNSRLTFVYCFFPLIKLFENLGLIKHKENIIKKIITSLEKNKKKIEKEAIEISNILKNKKPLFYATNFFYPIAYKMQISYEEDIKDLCHSNRISEIFHYEIEALPDNSYLPILLINKKEITPFIGQLNFFKKHIKDFYEFPFYNYSKEERVFMMLFFSDILNYHLSITKNTRFGETPLSDKIKKI